MKVPYTGYLTQSTESAPPTAYQNSAGASPEAFGAGVGQALKGLGAGISKDSNVLAKTATDLQDTINDGEAREADAKAIEQIGALRAGYTNLSGKAAIDGLKDYQDGLHQTAADIAAGISNPAAKKAFTDVMSRRVASAVAEGSSFAAGQAKQYAQDSGKARIGLMQQDGSRADVEDSYFQNNLKAIQEQSLANSKEANLSPEQTELARRGATSQAWSLRLQQISAVDPAKAFTLYGANKDAMDPATAGTIGAHIHSQMVSLGAKQEADKILSSGSSVGQGYLGTLGKKENASGDPNASPGTSSALGKYQFTKGTWQGLMDRYPDLKLTADGRTDNSQQDRAIVAFTNENASALGQAGIQANDKNLYLAHFMGTGGAISFIKAMEATPSASARLLFPDAAAANHSVFFNPDGSPRSLQEVYNIQCKNFSNNRTDGVSPITADSNENDLGKAMKLAEDRANAIAPGDTDFLSAMQARITTKYNMARNAKRVETEDAYSSLQDTVFGNPAKGAAPVMDMNQVLSNPEMLAQWNKLSPTQRQQLQGAVVKNAKPDTAETQAGYDRYYELKGMAETNPGEFVKQAFASEPLLSRSQIGDLMKTSGQLKQQATKTPEDKTLQDAAEDAVDKMRLKETDPRYNQFFGVFKERAMQMQGQRKAPLNSDELTKLASSLAREVIYSKTVRGKHFMADESGVPDVQKQTKNAFEPAPEGATIQIPDEARKMIVDRFRQNGMMPSEDEIQSVYSGYLKK